MASSASRASKLRQYCTSAKSPRRSFEALEAYARDRDGLHQPAWAAFNRAARDARGDVGIWHETYLVKAEQYESIYSGMPPTGLGAAGTLEPATGTREDARGRLAAG
jgi:hypothetical protein